MTKRNNTSLTNNDASSKKNNSANSNSASSGDRKYSPAAQKEVEKEMHDYKRGKAHSGPSGKSKVKNPKQAIAIGLSKARAKGAKVPPKDEK